jgi:lipopolysaccharide/colanic/teichoic acid biosynthesis glycosyltransferase
VDEVFVYPRHQHDWTLVSYSIPVDRSAINAGGDEETEVVSEIATLISQCREMAVPVHIRLPIDSVGGKNIVEKIGGYNVLTMTANYAGPVEIIAKRMLDIIGGLAGSFVAIIVIAVIGPIIKKESPGPILFKQVRIGKNGRRFTCYKIRSMYLDAEERKEELMDQNRVSDGMMFKLEFDPRIIGNKVINGKQVTGIGEKIRSMSLDEFPQFFNVLKGDMSLVGTRPPTEDEWEKYKYHHRARLAIKPGITGMWQVNGRSDITDFEKVVKLDTEYINNWSFSKDLKILFKTVKIVLKKEGAM